MKRTTILFTGLPFIFNETLRKEAGIKDGEIQLEKVVCKGIRYYDVLPEWCALSSCYFETLLSGLFFRF